MSAYKNMEELSTVLRYRHFIDNTKNNSYNSNCLIYNYSVMERKNTMDDTLHYLIMANQMLVQKALMEQLKDTGLTIGQPKILDYLKEHDGSNQKEIAKACFLEAGSLTIILNRMEEKGLIERRILNGNRRSFHIFLTAEGKEKQKLVDRAFSEIEKEALVQISAEDYGQFMSVYHRIYDNLSGICENRQKNDTELRKKEPTDNE